MRNRIFRVLRLVLIVLIINTIAGADSIILSPCDFNQAEDDNDYFLDLTSLYSQAGSTARVFFAPIHLPQDAYLTSVVVFYKDNHATGNVEVSLLKCNAYTEALTEMATYTSSGSSSSRQSYKISPIRGGNSINNSGYSYNCYVNFTDASAGENVKVYLVKINYQTF